MKAETQQQHLIKPETIKVLFVLLVVYAAMIHYFVLHSSVAIFSVDQLESMTEAQVIESEVLTPSELPTAGWQTQTLPDDWYHSQRDKHQYWYRFQVKLEPDKSPVWAIYLPSVTHNAAVYLNGVWVGQGGQFEQPVSRHHNNPLLFEFSSALLTEGSNQIDMVVKASHPSQGLLDHIYIAPLDVLTAAYDWKHFLRVDFIKWITFAMYFMGGIVLVFWLARPQDKIYGIFAFQLFIWATHNLNLFIFDIPVSAHLWEAMTMSTLGWTVVLMIFFNHRFVGDQNVFFERLALILGVLGLGIYFLPDIGRILTIGYGIWDSFLIFFGCYAIIHLSYAFWRQRQLDIYLMLLAGVPILIFGLHDILLVNHVMDRREGLIIQYSVIPAMFLFSWFLIRRFVQSINQAEQLAATLEARVVEKEKEIISQYEQLHVLEQQKVLADERERMMRDMHDGIGGQLVSVIASLQEHHGEVFHRVREQIQQSLIDLRFVIESLDPVLNDIATLLGMMRARLAEQLQAANITLQWDICELPELDNISPQRSLHIMRIVQEAVTNVVKHSHAETLVISTRLDPSQQKIHIDILDDGDGVANSDKNGVVTGRGIDNMTYRAAQIDAELTIQPRAKGTLVRLSLAY